MQTENEIIKIDDKKTNDKMVYTVDEIKNMLGIGKNQAYALANGEAFHVCHIGKKIVVPKIAFENWLLGNDQRVS